MIIIERKKENLYERGRGNKVTCVKKVMKLRKDNQSSQGRKKKTCAKTIRVEAAYNK